MPNSGTVYFHAAHAEKENGYLFRDSHRILAARRIEDVPRVLEAVERATNGGHFAAGYVAYEAAAAFEQTVPSRALDVPYAWFGIYEHPERASRNELVQVLGGGSTAISHVRFSVPPSRYRRQIETVRDLIHEGDVYQINYTGQIRFDLDGPPGGLFLHLLDRQPVPYAAFLDIGDAQILSCSPELFFRLDGRRVVTRPMKGTAMRGASSDDDARIQERLAGDAKNRAENLMIVDLLRNDLSRCCKPGSVRVVKLFETERFETLIQMSSEIEGVLRGDVGLTDVFRALFPCGSVTGAPKISAMTRIDELEDEPRGVYCGAIGFVEPGGRSVFNVAIRTMLIRKNVGRLGVGSGVVWDSDAESEYEECLLKARFLVDADRPESRPFYLIETMLAENGRIALLNLHLNRVTQSAAYFGIPADREVIRRRIADEPAPEGRHRVRLTVDEDGSLGVTSSSLSLESGTESSEHSALAGAPRVSGPSPRKWRVAVSERRVDSQDPMRRHKTSSRALYEEEYEKARERGFDEVLFLNERGEPVEGSRSNLFVRTGNAWRTPPETSGALPGVYRRHLIESTPRLVEEVLYVSDLVEADAVYFSNAVRGLVEAEIVFHAAEHAYNQVTG